MEHASSPPAGCSCQGKGWQHQERGAARTGRGMLHFPAIQILFPTALGAAFSYKCRAIATRKGKLVAMDHEALFSNPVASTSRSMLPLPLTLQSCSLSTAQPSPIPCHPKQGIQGVAEGSYSSHQATWSGKSQRGTAEMWPGVMGKFQFTVSNCS